MSIRARVIWGLVAILAAMAFACGAIVWTVIEQKTRLVTMDDNSRRLTDSEVPLLLAIEGLKFDIVQVQQFLFDVSATHHEDGYKYAETFAARFSTDMAEAQKQAKALLWSDTERALDDIDRQFPAYNQFGR